MTKYFYFCSLLSAVGMTLQTAELGPVNGIPGLCPGSASTARWILNFILLLG